MSNSSFRKWIRTRLGGISKTRTPIRNDSARLAVEMLEDRTVPAGGHLVYNATDATPLTLRAHGGSLELVTTSGPLVVYATESLSEATDATISGNGFDFQLTIDSSVSRLSGGITFLGGTGNTTLVGPSAGKDWHLTGVGTGDIGDSGFVSFTGVRNLVGGSGSDTFIAGSAGQLAGVLDGGTGATDRLVFDEGNGRLVTFAPTGVQSGVVSLLNRTFTYAGLELGDFYFSQFGDSQNVVISGNPITSNDLFLRSYQGLVEVGKTGSSESIAFKAPQQSLRVELAAVGEAKLTIGEAGNPLVLPGSLTVTGGVLADAITVNGQLDIAGKLTLDGTLTKVDESFGLDTITINGGITTNGGEIYLDSATIIVGTGTLSTASSGDAGDITLRGRTLEVSGKLLATATGSATQGDITLEASVYDVLGAAPVDIIPTFDPSIHILAGAEIRGGEIAVTATQTSQSNLLKFSLLSLQDKQAEIVIANAAIVGTNVTIAATSEDANALESDQYNLVNNLATQPFLGSAFADIPTLLGLPVQLSAVSVQKRSADAIVTVTGSAITASGDVSIGSKVEIASDAQPGGGYDSTKKKAVKPIDFAPFSAGYSRAQGSAVTTLDGTTTIDSEGSVSIVSDAKTSATVSSFTASNALFGSKPKKAVNGLTSFPAVAIAVTESDTTSNAIVGSGVQIRATGNVTVNALADVTNNARSGSAVFGDGLGSFGFASGSDKTNVLSRVDGQITAGGTSTVRGLDVSGINAAANTIRIPNHGLVDGQVIVYRAITPDDPSTSLEPLGGLTDGEAYRVIVVDADTIQLAKAASLSLDAEGLSPGTQNTMSRRAVTSAGAAAVNLVSNVVTLGNHGFSELQAVTPVTTGDFTLVGLGGDDGYRVHVIDVNRFQIVTKLRENAGANPQILAGTNYYIVDFELAPPKESETAVPQGSLYLGYNEAAKVFDASTAVQAGGTLEIAGHGYQTGDVVNYGVIQSASPTRVTLDRTSLFSPAAVDLTFDPSDPNAGVADNTIYLANGHDFVTGQRVTYSAGGGAAIGGLVEGGTYYVINDGVFGIRLASTPANAFSGIGVPLSSAGAGTAHRLTGVVVDTANDWIVIRDHQFQTGQEVVYDTDGGAPVGGLTPGATYYAIRISNDVVRFARTRTGASAGIAIDLTTGAGGLQHAFSTDKFVSVIDATQTAPVVDYTANTIQLRGHGLTSGTRVTYDPGEDAAIGGLTAGEYVAIVIDVDHIQLATVGSPNTPIDLLPGTPDTGWQEFTFGDESLAFDPLQQATVDVSSDTIWLRNHGFLPGERVTYLTGGGSPIGGLVDGQEYLVLAGPDENSFRLANPLAPNTPLDLTSAGSGELQGFERASTADRGTSAIRGLRDGGTYYVTRLDVDHIRLSLTEEAAYAAAAIDLSPSVAQQSAPDLQHAFSDAPEEKSGINVLASLTAENRQVTDAQVGGSPTLSHMLLGYLPIDPKMAYKASLKETKVATTAPVTLSGSTALNDYVHTVQAVVGSAAVLHSDANVTVNATSENFSQVIANGKVITPKTGLKLLAAGTAVAIGSYENTALATVESGATIDALAATTVTSEVTYPDLTKFLPFNPDRFQIGDPDNGDWTAELGTALNGRGGLDQIFNVWVNSTSTTGKRPAFTSVTGSYGSAGYKNRSEAVISAGAKINQNTSSPGQSVGVAATTTMTLLNLAGNLKLEVDPTQVKNLASSRSSPISAIGNQAGSVGLGGSFLLQDVSNTTLARIDTGAMVHTGTGAGGGLDVTATEQVSSINLAQAGGASGFFGISGTLSDASHSAVTHAELGSGVQVTGGALDARSYSDVSYVNFAGAVQVAGAIGFGVSVAKTNLTRDTSALIGSPLPAGSGNAGTVLDVVGLSLGSSNTGNIIAGAVTGAVVDGTLSKQLSGANPRSLPVAVAVAGSFAINTVTDTTRSYINDAALVTLAQGDLALDSRNKTRVLSVAGSIAAAASKTVTIGLAGALSQNKVAGTTESLVIGADIINVGSVDLSATRDGEIRSIAIAASASSPAAAGKGSMAGTGLNIQIGASVAENTIGGGTGVRIANARIRARDEVELTADDLTRITSDAGGVALSRGKGGINVTVGASGAINDITTETLVRIEDSDLATNGDVVLLANSKPTIDALAFGGSGYVGMGKGSGIAVNLAGAGAGTGNRIANTIAAEIVGGSVLSNNGAVELRATDGSLIHADAGAVAVVLGLASGGSTNINLTVGASAAVNEITNSTRAAVLGSGATEAIVTAAEGISIAAVSESKIDTLSIAGALSATLGGSGSIGVNLAGAGAASVNSVANLTDARIESATVTSQTGSVLVTADDKSVIHADAGGVAVALALASNNQTGIQGTVGAAIALNDVANVTTAILDGADVQSPVGLSVRAAASAVIDALSVAGAGSVATGSGQIGISFAGAGSASDNALANTVAAEIRDGSRVETDGSVTVSARDNSTINADSLGAALGVSAGSMTGATLAVGVSVALNEIDNTIRATVEDSELARINGSVNVTAIDATQIDAKSVAATLAITSGNQTSLAISGGGAVSQNVILTTTNSIIDGSQLGTGGSTVGSVTLTSSSDATIEATVVGASAALAFGPMTSVGVAVGIGVARNFIGYERTFGDPADFTTQDRPTSLSAGTRIRVAEGALAGDVYRYIGAPATDANGFDLTVQNYGDPNLWVQINSTESPAEVQGIVRNSSISTTGALAIDAAANQRIDATVAAVAVGLTSGGQLGVGIAGAGAYAENRIKTRVTASVDGDGASGISATSARLLATDTSSIHANAIGGSVALTFSAQGVAISPTLGLAIATNSIANVVEASVRNADQFLMTAGGLELSATSHGTIDSQSIAASFGVAFGGNMGGIAVSGAGAMSQNVVTSDTLAVVMSSEVSTTGDVVIDSANASRISSRVLGVAGSVGAGPGRFGLGIAIGAAAARNLIGETPDGLSDTAQVRSVVQDSGIQTPANLVVDAQSNATITADVDATSVAVAAAVSLFSVAIGLSGAGASTDNQVAFETQALIDGDGAGIAAAEVTLDADDTSLISADTGAIAVAASLGFFGAAASVGVALADNSIRNKIEAIIRNADDLRATVGGVSVTSDETANIDADTESSSGAGTLSLGIALSGAVTKARNTIASDVTSAIESSTVISAGDVDLTAANTSTIDSNIDAASFSIGLVSLGMGTIRAENTIGGTVDAHIAGSVVTANGAGDINVLAASRPTIDTSSNVGAYAFLLGGAGAGGSSETTISDTVRAFATDSTLTAVGDDVQIRAESVANASPRIAGEAFSLVAVTTMSASANLGGSTQASLGGTSTINANHVEVLATDELTATPSATVDGGGAFAITVANAALNITRQTEANIADNADLSLGSTGLDVVATSNNNGSTTGSSVTGSLISVGDISLGATVGGATRAAIGAGATVRSNGSLVGVSAQSTKVANTELKSIGVGVILNVGGGSANASTTGTTTAEVLGNVVGTSPTNAAGGLNVSAGVNERAAAYLSSGSGGLIDVNVSGATADAASAVTARIGSNRTINVAGDVAIRSQAVSEADAASRGASGGLVTVGVLSATANSRPLILSEIGSSTNVTAGGRIDLSARTPLSLDRSDRTRAESGDGFTTAASATTTGGVVTVQDANSSTTVAPIVVNRVGQFANLSATGIGLEAVGNTGGEALTAGAGGSLIAVGDVDATLTDSTRVQNIIDGSAKLTASNSLSLNATANLDDYVTSSADIGGFVSFVGANTTVNTNFTVENVIGASASLSGPYVSANAVTNVSAFGRSDADSGGLGANSRSSNSGGNPDAADLKGVKITGTTRTVVDSGASVVGDAVLLAGRVDSMYARMEARSRSSGFGTDADAVANVDVFDTAGVVIASGATVQGRSRVDLVARHSNLNATSNSSVTGASAFGDSDSTSITDVDSVSSIVTQAGAKVIAHDFTSETTYYVAAYDRRAEQSGGIDFGAQRERGDFNVGRSTSWLGDLVINGKFTDRRLVIAADGSIESNQGMTPIVNGAGRIYAIDTGRWTADELGSVRFTANTVGVYDGMFALPSLFVTGAALPTFTFNETPRVIEVIDHRPNSMSLFLQVLDIDPINSGPAPKVTLEVENVQTVNGAVFAVHRNYAPTDITIDTNAELSINAINNPIGTTTIRSTASFGFDKIVTHDLDIRTGGDAGYLITTSTGNGPPTSRYSEAQLTYTTAGAPSVYVAAGGSVNMQLTGLMRVPTGGFTADVLNLTANTGNPTGNAKLNVVFNPAVAQYDGGWVGPVVVEKTLTSNFPFSVPAGTKNVYSQYRATSSIFGVNLDPPTVNLDVFGQTLPGQVSVNTRYVAKGPVDRGTKANIEIKPGVDLDYADFTEVGTLPGTVPTASILEWADFNRDGALDLAAVSGTRLSLMVNETATGGGFREVFSVDTGAAITALAWGDANGDQLPDLAIQRGGQTVVLTNAAGAFSGASISIPQASGSNGDLAWGDFDNDLDLDLLDAGSYGVTIHEFQNGVVVGTVGVTFLTTTRYTRVDVGDYDRDGDLDILAGGGGALTRIFRNDGISTFSDSGLTFPAVTTGPALFGDSEGDGDLDVMVLGAPDGAGNARLAVYLNDGGLYRLGDTVTGPYDGALWYDHDRDGDRDFLVHLRNPDRTHLLVTTPRPVGSLLPPSINYPMDPQVLPNGVSLQAWAAAPFVGGPGVDLVYASTAGGVPTVKLYENLQPVSEAATPVPTGLGANVFLDQADVFWSPPAGTVGAGQFTYNLRFEVVVAGGPGTITTVYEIATEAGRGAISGTTWKLDNLPLNAFIRYSVQAVDATGRRSAWTDQKFFETPNAITVTSAGDGNDGDILNGVTTLREAVAYSNANGGGISIRFEAGLPAITLATPLVITESVSIEGQVTEYQSSFGTRDLTVIQGGGSGRLFTIDDSSSDLIDVAITGVTLRGGRADYGGAAYSSENLTMKFVTFNDNQATVDGGSVYADVPVGGRALFVDLASFTNPGSGFLPSSAGRDGGVLAIQNAGTVEFQGNPAGFQSPLQYNTAGRNGGAISIVNAATGQVRSAYRFETLMINSGSAGQFGGGIAVINNGGSVDLSGLSASQNTAQKGGGLYLQNNGGTAALGLRQTANTAQQGGGYFIQNTNGQVTARSTQVAGNEAQVGAGLYLDQTGGSFRMDVSLVDRNKATAGDGGGLYVRNVGGQFVLDTSLVESNTATGAGGGLAYTGTGGATVVGSTFAGNAAARGAGVDAQATDGTFLLTSSTISGNALTGAGAAGGAGLDLDLGATAAGSVVATTVAFNSATAAAAGAAVEITAATGATTLVRSTLIADNTVPAGGTAYRYQGPTVGRTEDSNWVGTNAGLQPLSTVAGGLVGTHRLNADSPAVDQGASAAGLPATDQRGTGFARAVGRPDVGAFERQAATAGRTFVVSAAGDRYDSDFSDGNLTFVEAVALANGSLGTDTITFAQAIGINLSGVDAFAPLRLTPTITDSVRIVGPGADKLTMGFIQLVVDDGDPTRSIDVEISGLTFYRPIALDFAENVTLRNVVVDTPVLSTSFTPRPAAGETFRLENSFLQGTGLSAGGAGQTVVQNSTILGGITVGGSGSATVRNSTLTGGISGIATVESSIVSFVGAGSTVTNSLIRDGDVGGQTATAAGTPDANGNLVGSASGSGLLDPLLGPVLRSGGTIPVLPLLAGSPAINRGANPAGLTTDARGPGFVRVQGAAADIGAFEAQARVFTVGTGANVDNGDYSDADLSLVEAIRLANQNPGADTIRFADTVTDVTVNLQPGSYTTDDPFVQITESVSIEGRSDRSVRLSASTFGVLVNPNLNTVFDITDGTAATIDVRFSGVTFQSNASTFTQANVIGTTENLTLDNVAFAGTANRIVSAANDLTIRNVVFRTDLTPYTIAVAGGGKAATDVVLDNVTVMPVAQFTGGGPLTLNVTDAALTLANIQVTSALYNDTQLDIPPHSKITANFSGVALTVRDSVLQSNVTRLFTNGGTVFAGVRLKDNLRINNASNVNTTVVLDNAIIDGFGPAVIAPGAVSTPEDTPIDIDLRTFAGAGTIRAVYGAVGGTVVLLPDGFTARFTPNADFTGAAQFGYDVDGPPTQPQISPLAPNDPVFSMIPTSPVPLYATSRATVTVNVTPVDDPFRVSPQPVTGTEDQTLDIDLLTFASDPDSPLVPLTFTITGSTADSAVLLPDGHTVRLTFALDFNGPADVTFDVTDETTTYTNVTVPVTVTAVNDAPTASVPSAPIITNEQTYSLAGITVADVDTTNLSVTVTVSSGNLRSGGLLQSQFQFNGTATDLAAALAATEFVPDVGFVGTVTFLVAASDASAQTQTTFDLYVRAVNRASQVIVPTNASSANEFLTGVSVSDVDSATLVVTVSTARGLLIWDGEIASSISRSGTPLDLNLLLAGLSYIPDVDATGPTPVRITANDGENSPSIDALVDVVSASHAVLGVTEGRFLIRYAYGSVVGVSGNTLVPLPSVQTQDGASWFLGTVGVGGDAAVYRWAVGEAAVQVDSAQATRLALTGDGSIVVQDPTGVVLSRTGSASGLGSAWTALGSVTTSDGATWFVGADGQVYRWPVGGSLMDAGQAAVTIALDGAGRPRVTTVTGQQFVWTGTAWVNPNPSVTKSLFDTSLADTSGNNVNIGETATFGLLVTVPEVTDPVLVVTDGLPPGMIFTGFTVVNTIAGSGGLLTGDFNGTGADASNIILSGASGVGGVFQDGDDPVFTFTNPVVATGVGGSTDNQFLILVTARVADVGSNTRGQTLAAPVTLTVTEPQLQVAKTVVGDNTLDGGATATYQLVISHTGLSNGPAYLLNIQDAIPAGLTFVNGSATIESAPVTSNAAIVLNGSTLQATADKLLLGETITITYQARVNAPGGVNVPAPGASITNTATIDATSAPINGRSPTQAQSQTTVIVNTNTLSGFVYVDADNDGTFDSGETPLGNVPVTLTGTDIYNQPVSVSTVTLADGSYQFSGLRPGTYTVTESRTGTAPDNTVNPELTLWSSYSKGFNTPGTTFGPATGLIPSASQRPVTSTITSLTIPSDSNASGIDYNFAERINSDLMVTKISSLAPTHRYRPNSPITYTIVVTNIGQTNVTGATVADIIPANILNVTWTTSTVGAAAVTSGATGSGNNLSAVLDIAAGAGNSVTFTVTGTVSAAARTSLVNTATVTLPVDPTAPQDPTPENNTSSVTDAPPLAVTNRLTGRVYLDRNQNSVYEAAIDRPLAGITVTLRNSAGTIVATALTASDGTYRFANLPPGRYTVTETQPTGFGSSQVRFNVRTVTMTRTSVVTNQNFGDTLGIISGKVYRDNNLNGVFNTNTANPDRGIRGITVTLTDMAGNPVLDAFGNAVAPVLTDINGNYRFNDLLPGEYLVTETQPPLPTILTAGHHDGADNPGSLSPSTPPIWTPSATKNSLSLLLGINNTPTNQLSQIGRGYNFGELPPARAFGFVYVDSNNNGIKDPGERGIAGVAITISGIAFAGTPFARPLVPEDVAPGGSLTVFTDANGRYDFRLMPPGRYAIRERQPAGYIDGREQIGDPRAPAPGIGNDVFFNLLMNPFPVRGPFNFGERLPGTSTTISLRGLLGSSMI